MRPITRRGFLRSSGAIGLVAAAGVSGVSIPPLRPEGSVISFLTRAVPDLEMSETDLRNFARDMVERIEMSQPKQIAYFNMLEYDRLYAVMPEGIRASQARNEEEIVTAFMLSTDYLNPARTGPAVYLGFADPYQAGCANPLPGWLATAAS